MALLQAINLHHSYGDQPILDNASLTIDAGERVCLVGRNGCGKSTLLKMIAGRITADGGEIIRPASIRISELPQEVPASMPGTVYDCIAGGIGGLARIITDWHHVAIEAATNPDALKRLQSLQDQIEANQAWNLETRISSTISRLKLPA